MTKFDYASDKLCAMTLHRGTIIQIDREFLHVRMLMSMVMPPRLQTIHNKVRRLMGLTKKDRQGVPYHIEHTKRDNNCFDLCIMVIRFSGFFCPIFTASRAIPNFDLRFTINTAVWRKLGEFTMGRLLSRIAASHSTGSNR